MTRWVDYQQRAELIKELIEDSRLSLSEVGEVFGITRQRVWQIYHNRPSNRKYNTIRRKIIKKHCNLCGSKKRLQVHHVDNNPDNNKRKNLLVACIVCHQRLHNSLSQYDKAILPSEVTELRDLNLPRKPYSMVEIEKEFGIPVSTIRARARRGSLNVLPIDKRKTV